MTTKMPKARPLHKYRLLAETVLLLAAAVLLSHLAREAMGLPRQDASDFLLDGLLLAMLCLPLIYWRSTRRGKSKDEHGNISQHVPTTPAALSLAILAFFLAGTGVSVWLSYRLSLETRVQAQARFEAQANLLEESVISRFDKPVQALKGLRAMHAIERDFWKQQFRDYWAVRGFTADFPGVRGFGYIAHVPAGKFDAFLAAERRDQGPEFQVKTLGPVSERYVIKLVEPVEDNRSAIGLDIGSERVRRTAAEEALRSGQPTLTGVITLVQDGRQGPGFLLLLPVYRPGARLDTEAQRQESLMGFVYSPLVAEELFKPLLLLAQGQVHFDLEVRSPHDPPRWAFQSDRHSQDSSATASDVKAARSLFTTNRHFMYAGMEFRLQVRSTPAYESSIGLAKAWLLGLGGITFSALLSFVMSLLASGRARAQARAVELTGELHRLAAIARRTNDAVIITDTQGHISWVNDAFTRITGYSLAEALGRKPGALLQSEQTDPATVATIREHLARLEDCHVEILNRHKDGRHYWLELEIQPLFDDDRNLTGFMSVERDITQQREAQLRERVNSEQLASALRETDALMKTIETHAIVSEASRDGRILRVNDAFCRISGYSREELVGQNHRIVDSGTHSPEFWVAMWRTIASGQPWRGQICNRARDGSLYWEDSIIAPFVNESGQIEKYVSIRFDITQARRNEAELARERQRLQTTLEGTNVGTWEVNVITGENRIDERWARMLGYTLQELAPVTPAKWQTLIHPGDEKIAQSRLMDYLHGLSDIYEIERRLKHKDGHWIWVLSRGIVSTRRPDGHVEWMAGTHMDVTERHMLQEEIEHRNELMSAIMENLPGGLSAFDADLNLILRNSKFANLLKLPESLLNQQPTTFESIIRFNAERGEYGAGNLDQTVATIVERARHPVAHVMERTRPDGTTLEVRGVPLPGGGFVTTYTDVSARKALERELQASEEMLERAGQVAGIGGWTLDLQTNALNWSRQTHRIHEVPEDFVPTLENAIGFYTAESRREITRLVERAIREGEAYDAELSLVTAKGRAIWVRAIGEVEFVDGKPARLIGAFQDITVRRQLEHRVREQNQLLTAVLENMPGGLVAFDANLTLIMRNRQFATLLNFPETVFQGQRVQYQDLIRNEAERGEFGDGDVDAIVEKAVTSAKSTDEKVFERVRPNGQVLEVRMQRMNGGGVLFMLIDVTQRKQAELEARRADEMLRQAINTLDEAFVIYDAQDRLLMCNQRYRDTYPIAAAVMKPGVTFEELIRYGAEHGEYAAAIGRVDEWVAERMRQHLSANTDLVQELGNGRFIRIVERKTSDGFIVGFRIDITDLVRARLAAEEASKSKSQFLANMSHEIRTPMNAILGMLSLLQNTELSVRQQDYVNKTEGAAKSLLGLLNDILDFSKVEAGKMTLEAAPFRIDHLMRDLSVILSSNTGDKRMEVLFDIDPRLPAILVGDSLRLKQVLINLGGNAIKFTEKGMVLVRIAVQDLHPSQVTLEFSVRDTGIGIAPESLQRIFEGFSQAEASTTRRFGGTGLGLAISARLVRLMGGQLHVDSELGLGSRFHFRITLPVAKDSLPALKPPEQAALRELRVLIIDDNPTARDVLQAMATPMGWQVELAGSGGEALARIRERIERRLPPYDAVFVDWQMPGLDGWDTSLEIRRLFTGAASPIVVMVTAHGRDMLSRRPADEQALINGFLVKPVTPSMLLDAVVDALDARSGTRRSPVRNQIGPRLQGMRVLVVEDNKVNQQVAQELLEREGARVTLADNGALGVQAIASSASEPWHVVLMDVQMPVMDGYTATRTVRQELGLTELPIIAMTANAMESDRQDALAAGMNAHVGKPFNLDELVRTMLQHSGFVPEAGAVMQGPETAAPPPAPTELPAGTAELDIASAAQRLGGEVSVLLRVLQSFARDLPAMPSELARLLAAGQGDDARRLLHTLKGTAATVGAMRLSSLAAGGEQRLRDGPLPSGDEAQALVARVQAGAQAVLADLEPMLQGLQERRPQGPATPAKVDSAQLRRDLARLLALLQNSDLACLDAYAELRDRHGAALQQELDALDEAMAALDFEQAASLCETLEQRYTA